MKKTLLTMTLLCIATIAMSQNAQVKRNDFSQLTISFSSPTPSVSYTKVLDNGFCLLSMDNFQLQAEAGLPALPTLPEIIEVPLGDGLYYEIDNMQCDTVDGSALGINGDIVPAQPSRSKSDNSVAKLVKDQTAYSTDAFCGLPVIQLEAIGIARDRNLARICFNPVRWNPVTNQLLIVKNLTVTVKQQNADAAATRRMQKLHRNPAFNIGVETLNALGGKDSYTSGPLRYTIVAHSMFRGALDSFAAWKKQQGFLVDLVYTDESNVGSTTSSIKNYLKGLYDNATANSPAPTYVLFVGDIAQVPAFNLSSIGETHSSDLSYCCWTGNDYLPDCYYGRFSAQNLEQLSAQVNKTLMYEQYTFPDDSYLSTAALIAGVDGGYSSDYAYTYADPNMDYAAKTYIKASNGYNNVYYYKNNISFAPDGVTVTGSSNNNSASTALINIYNNGCGFVNYTAHGSETGWYKPSLTNSNVAALTNNNKPMVVIGNCCLTNSYQIDECFGEAFLRKGDNAGAVIYIGASNSTYWGEDFNWSVGVRTNVTNTCDPSYDAEHLGMYDKLFHSHGENYSNWFITAGAMMYAGNMTVENSSSSRKEYYWQIYHVMGDPSLMPYIKGAAQYPTANIPAAMVLGSNSLNITTVPYAYIGFTDNQGNLVGAGFADANGNANLTITPVSTVSTHQVVISAQGYRPLIQNVNVIANGPFVNATGVSINSRTAGDSIRLNLTLKNLGTTDADNITVELRSNSTQILLDSIGQRDLGYGIASGSELSVANIATGIIASDIADKTRTPITVIVRWGNTVNDMSTNVFYFTLKAPGLLRENYTLMNYFDTADYSLLTVTDSNNGSVVLNNATITLTCLDPSITLAPTTTSIESLNAGETITNTYTVTANGEVPQNRAIPVIRTVSTPQNPSLLVDTLKLLFGMDNRVITFEDESWNDYNWSQGDYPWELTDNVSYEGTYSLRSRTWSTSTWGSNTGNGCNSQISIEWTSTVDDSISFYRKVSSENNYDFYRFYIDGQQKEEASGEQGWAHKAYFVPAGTHTFTFSYEKDYSARNGSDCAWIDNLHLPISGTPYIYSIDSICKGEEYIFNIDTIDTDELTVGNHIFFDSNETGVYYLTLVVNDSPELSVTGNNTVIRKGEGVRLTVSGADRYEWYIEDTFVGSGDILDVFPEETTIYTAVGYKGSCSESTNLIVFVEGTIGIDAPQTTITVPQLTIYPNPATDIVNIASTKPIQRIAVYDLQGKQVFSTYPSTAEAFNLQITTSELQKGIYIIHSFCNDGTSTIGKLVKK